MTITPGDSEMLAGMSFIALAWGAARHYPFPLMLVLATVASGAIILMASVGED